MIRETDELQPAFLELIPFHVPHLRFFRRSNAVTRVHGRMMTFGLAGMPDLYGIFDGGMHLEVELKGAKGRLSPEQIIFQGWCADHRVPYLLLKAKAAETIQQTAERWCAEVQALATSLGQMPR